jgi:hypothetical protein
MGGQVLAQARTRLFYASGAAATVEARPGTAPGMAPGLLNGC